MGSVTYKNLLLGHIVSFLNEEGMTCSITQEGVCELTCRLLHYREEDKVLRPEIFIIDDIANLRMLSSDVDLVEIGRGGKKTEVITEALKRCAPLCERYWAIYILRCEDHFEYGLFKKESSSIASIVVDAMDGDVLSGIIMIHQISETAVLIKGSNSRYLVVHFGTDNPDKDPFGEQKKYVKSIVSIIDEENCSPVYNFIRRVFDEVQTNGHGTLSCVLDAGAKYPDSLKDGVILSEPIVIPRKISEAKTDSNNSLESYKSLIVGMLNSDGITVFSNDGKVLAYRVFIKHKESEEEKVSGGARSRTFKQLKKMGSDSGIVAGYMQTQEGIIESFVNL